MISSINAYDVLDRAAMCVASALNGLNTEDWRVEVRLVSHQSDQPLDHAMRVIFAPEATNV